MEGQYYYDQSHINLAGSGFGGDDQSYDLNLDWEYLSALITEADGAGNAGGFLGPFAQGMDTSYTPLPDNEDKPVKRFACGDCGYQFEYKKDLDSHVKSKHPRQGEPVFKCRCGKTDTRKDNHKRHAMKCKKPYIVGSYYTCICGVRYADFSEYLGQGGCNSC